MEQTDSNNSNFRKNWLARRVEGIRTWGEFVKVSHTVFALPFALIAMLLAARGNRGWPGWRVFLLILLSMVFARTCAMAFNRIVDRKFDAENPRTANRHLPTGQISLPSAWSLWAFSAGGLVAAAFFINPLCFYLSPVALFIVCFYSLTKRFTDFTHVYLGIALALAPLGAWMAVRGDFAFLPLREGALIPFVLGISVVCWLIGFDIIYATQDYEFDKTAGLHSLVVRWGIPRALKFAFTSHLVMWGILLALGILLGFRVAYFSCLAIILFSLVLEHWLARKRNLKWINIAFFRLNALISIVLFAAVLIEVASFGK